jgi:hypothetical protein
MKAHEIMKLDIDDQEKLEMMIEKEAEAYDFIEKQASITPEGYQDFEPKYSVDKIEKSYRQILGYIAELSKRVREGK